LRRAKGGSQVFQQPRRSALHPRRRSRPIAAHKPAPLPIGEWEEVRGTVIGARQSEDGTIIQIQPEVATIEVSLSAGMDRLEGTRWPRRGDRVAILRMDDRIVLHCLRAMKRF
jgi:hypothetical protein